MSFRSHGCILPRGCLSKTATEESGGSIATLVPRILVTTPAISLLLPSMVTSVPSLPAAISDAVTFNPGGKFSTSILIAPSYPERLAETWKTVWLPVGMLWVSAETFNAKVGCSRLSPTSVITSLYMQFFDPRVIWSLMEMSTTATPLATLYSNIESVVLVVSSFSPSRAPLSLRISSKESIGDWIRSAKTSKRIFFPSGTVTR